MKTIALPFVLTCAAASAASPSPQLALPGEHFHAYEVPARDGETWLALVVEDGTAKLVASTLEVEGVGDAIDASLDDRAGSVIAPGLAPRVLLRGMAGLRAGDVTVAIADAQPLSVDAPLRIALGGAVLNLVSRCTDHDDAIRCSVVADDGTTQQSLFDTRAVRGAIRDSDFGDATPTLLFAGDLDRDGRVDLLIDTSDHYNLTRPTLFLSGPAKPGEHVAEVARQSVTGC